jgi:hypothetical protein
MRVTYVIRRGDASGGAVDPDGAPYAEVDAAAELALPTPAPGEVRRYRVNARDEDTGLEEASSFEAELRASADEAEAALLRPRPVGHLVAIPGPTAGSIEVRWSYLHPHDARAPLSFQVWATASPGPIDFGDPPGAEVSYRNGAPAYRAALAGLAAGTAQLVAVRAVNPSGDDGATGTASLALPAASSTPPASLAAGTSWGS